MNRFVKHNLLLLIVISVSLVVALCLLVLAGIQHSQMTSYIARTDKLRKDIQSLINQTPAPVEGNEEPLKVNAQLYRKAAAELDVKFGTPFQPALDAFIQVLAKGEKEGKLTLGDVVKRFADERSQQNIDKDNFAQQQLFYRSFQQHYPNWHQALKAFRAVAEKVTTEPINDNTVNDVLLAAFGVPRTMGYNPDSMVEYLDSYKAKLLEMGAKLNVENAAAEFSFPTRAFTKEQYPLVSFHMEVIGDLFSRIAKTKLTSVENIKRHSFEGERSGNFILYRYELEVCGSLAEIRKLTELIDQGYQDNRVYLVKSVFLYEMVDEADDLMHPADTTASESSHANTPVGGMGAPGMPGMAPVSGRRGRRSGLPGGIVEMAAEPRLQQSVEEKQEARRRAEEERQKKLHPTKRSGYGVLVIGNRTDCRAVIDVTYVVRPVSAI